MTLKAGSVAAAVSAQVSSFHRLGPAAFPCGRIEASVVTVREAARSGTRSRSTAGRNDGHTLRERALPLHDAITRSIMCLCTTNLTLTNQLVTSVASEANALVQAFTSKCCGHVVASTIDDAVIWGLNNLGNDDWVLRNGHTYVASTKLGSASTVLGRNRTRDGYTYALLKLHTLVTGYKKLCVNLAGLAIVDCSLRTALDVELRYDGAALTVNQRSTSATALSRELFYDGAAYTVNQSSTLATVLLSESTYRSSAVSVWSREYIGTAAADYVADADSVTEDGVRTAANIAHASSVNLSRANATNKSLSTGLAAVTLFEWKSVYLRNLFSNVVCKCATSVKGALSCHAAASLIGVYTPAPATYSAVG